MDLKKIPFASISLVYGLKNFKYFQGRDRVTPIFGEKIMLLKKLIEIGYFLKISFEPSSVWPKKNENFPGMLGLPGISEKLNLGIFPKFCLHRVAYDLEKISMHIQSAWEAWQSHTHFIIDILRPENILKII